MRGLLFLTLLALACGTESDNDVQAYCEAAANLLCQSELACGHADTCGEFAPERLRWLESCCVTLSGEGPCDGATARTVGECADAIDELTCEDPVTNACF